MTRSATSKAMNRETGRRLAVLFMSLAGQHSQTTTVAVCSYRSRSRSCLKLPLVLTLPLVHKLPLLLMLQPILLLLLPLLPLLETKVVQIRSHA